MTRKMIINELNNRGFNAHAQELIRNGVKIEGIITFFQKIRIMKLNDLLII